MGTSTDITPPFGTYALPTKQEHVRVAAIQYAATRVGKWQISLARKRAIRDLSEPFDVTVAPGVKARLYPSTNRCEKRALCGVQIWDSVERAALQEAIAQPSERPFVFLDVGANVGLYSLFANAYAQAAGRDIRLVAVEPSSEMGERLTVNAQVSGANVELIHSAVATEPGEVFLSDGGGNRGEGQLASAGEPVFAMPLFQLCKTIGVSRIDALKLDIEGLDLAVLTQFLEKAPEALHPDLMILELDETSGDRLIELTQAHNYLVTKRTRMNVVVRKRDRT